jgi:hypothetical protein
MRLLGALAISSNAALYLAMGTNKGVFDVILLTVIFSSASAYAGILTVRRWKRVAIVITLLPLLASGFLGFFSGVALRPGSGVAYGSGPPGTGVYADMAKPPLSDMPETLRVLALGLTSYVSQGYYGLGLALEQPFVPMYGVGSSTFLTRQVARMIGDPSIEWLSYPVRVMNQDGWSAYYNWSTMYTWIASDVGFLGVLLVMVVAGWLLGQAWLGVLYNHDVLSVCLLGQMVIMLTYASANNQCVQSGESWFAFMSTLFLWFAAKSTKHRPKLANTRSEVVGPQVNNDTIAWTRILSEGR